MTARVDAGDELLAEEAAFGEGDRIPVEPGLLRDRRLVEVGAEAGNAGLDPGPLVVLGRGAGDRDRADRGGGADHVDRRR